MSQAVANAKQFGASTKSNANIKNLVGNQAAKNFGSPKIADKHGADEKNPYVSPRTLRAQKKQYKQNVEDAKSGKFDSVRGSGGPGPQKEYVDGEVVENPPIKDNRLPGPEQEIIDAEVIEPDRPALTDSPRMITSERIQPTKAIEPGRQWSNG
jgi:hypothetical protein